MTIMDTLMYLSALKNKQGSEKAIVLLDRMDMLSYKDKKLQELCKGMQQKIQVIAAIIHDPDFIILDEPFLGLDPVNVKLVQDMILEKKKEGKTILICTHMMDKIERMCDRIFMIQRGEMVLYSHMEEIKARYGNNTILLEYEGTNAKQVLKTFLNKVRINKFELSGPSLNEIFIELAERK